MRDILSRLLESHLQLRQVRQVDQLAQAVHSHTSLPPPLRSMPDSIREHLFNMEKLVLLYCIWDEKDRVIQKALTAFQQESSTPTPTQSASTSYERVLCRRLISHAATRVKEVCKLLSLNEEIQEKVWEALLQIFKHSSDEVKLLNNRNLDQMIICSIYALKRTRSELFASCSSVEIKFKNMI